MLEVGRTAPEFSLTDLAGDVRSLGDFLKNGATLVAFFKISCPTCQLTLPFLERLADRVQLVGISQDDTPSTREFLEYFRITYPVLIDRADSGYAVSAAYRLTNVPSLFLIEPDGTVSWSLNGFHRGDLTALAAQLGTVLFKPEERVPIMKPG